MERWSRTEREIKRLGVIFAGFVLDCWLALTVRPCCSGIGQSPCFFYLRAIDERFTGADRIAGPNKMEVMEAPAALGTLRSLTFRFASGLDRARVPVATVAVQPEPRINY